MGDNLAGNGIASAAAPAVFSIVRREYMLFIGAVPHGRQRGVSSGIGTEQRRKKATKKHTV